MLISILILLFATIKKKKEFLFMCVFVAFPKKKKCKSPKNFMKTEKVNITADSKHCFDLSGLVSAAGAADIYSRQYMPENFSLMVSN